MSPFFMPQLQSHSQNTSQPQQQQQSTTQQAVQQARQQQDSMSESPLLPTASTPVLPQYEPIGTPKLSTPLSLPIVSTPTLPKLPTPEYHPQPSQQNLQSYQFPPFERHQLSELRSTSSSFDGNANYSTYSDKFLETLLVQDDGFTRPSSPLIQTPTSSLSNRRESTTFAFLDQSDMQALSTNFSFDFQNGNMGNTPTTTQHATLQNEPQFATSRSYSIPTIPSSRRDSLYASAMARSNSGSPNPSGSGERQERGKLVHREAERQRRVSLRTGFEELKNLLPASTIGNYKSWSHTRLLESGLEYIEHLQEEVRERDRQNRKLKDALRKV
ncbi:UNVERIFIED_CONTAM: hypothetical protein HDU68_006009, partial [Siphonaria sp. JEL0065]